MIHTVTCSKVTFFETLYITDNKNGCNDKLNLNCTKITCLWRSLGHYLPMGMPIVWVPSSVSVPLGRFGQNGVSFLWENSFLQFVIVRFGITFFSAHLALGRIRVELHEPLIANMWIMNKGLLLLFLFLIWITLYPSLWCCSMHSGKT